MHFLIDRREEDAETTATPVKKLKKITMLGSVLRTSEQAALVDAHGLIAQARERLAQAYARAERIIAKAKKRAERVMANASNIYEQERKRGYAKGQKEAQAEQVAAMVALAEQKAVYLQGVEQDIVELVIGSVRKIIADFNDNDRVLTVVRTGLALLRQQKHVVLRVNAAEIDIVRQAMQQLLSEFPSVDYLDVVADDRYEPGTCRLEAEVGTVQTSLKAQLAILEQALREAVAPRTTAEEEEKSPHDDAPSF